MDDITKRLRNWQQSDCLGAQCVDERCEAANEIEVTRSALLQAQNAAIDLSSKLEEALNLRAAAAQLADARDREIERLQQEREGLSFRLDAATKEAADLRADAVVDRFAWTDLENERDTLRELLKAAESRLDESMKESAELRAKGRAAWEVLERYLLETRSLDLNRMPGSDDMLIALTGIRFLPPDEADMEWARQQAEKIGVVERQ